MTKGFYYLKYIPEQWKLVKSGAPMDEPDAPPGGRVVGISGQMGVRYGVQFYYVEGGAKIPVTSVEIDALDLPLGDFQPFGENSKILWCLIYLLKEDPVYKLLMRYIFPIPKILSTLAMYNDMGFLSAVGEVTVGPGDYNQFTPVSSGDNKKIQSVSDALGKFLNAFLRDGSKKSEWIPKIHKTPQAETYGSSWWRLRRRLCN